MLLLASALLLAAPPAPSPSPVPPLPLACLAKHYAVTAKQAGGAWFAELPDGTRIPWDDGIATKTHEERLASPDIEDVFYLPYPTGAIEPVTEPDRNPGGVRVERVFRATYGASAKAVEAKLVPVAFAGKTLRVHALAKPAFEAAGKRVASVLAADPDAAKFFEGLGGTFAWRTVAGTDRASSHSFGVSLDLNPSLGDYWRWSKAPAWKNRVPAAIVAAFEAEHFVWGGRWNRYDTMHFEWRPELFCEAAAQRTP